MGHPARSWSVWAELGGLTIVPLLAGCTVGFTLQACFELVAAGIFLLQIGGR